MCAFYKRDKRVNLPQVFSLRNNHTSQQVNSENSTSRSFTIGKNRKGFWKIKKNQRGFLDSFAKNTGIQHWEDWYKVTAQEIAANGGNALLFIYGSSIKKMLSSVYSEHPWDFLKFHVVEKNFYQSLAVQRQVFDRLAVQLNIKTWKDWYTVNSVHIRERNARSVFSLYNCSIYSALKTIYPEHPWRITDFKRVTEGFWNDLETQRKFMDEAAEKLSIREPKDWLRVKVSDFSNLGGASLLKLYENSLKKTLSGVYKEVNWEEFERVGTQAIVEGGKKQKHLFDILCTVFPEAEDLVMNHIMSRGSLDSVAIGNSAKEKDALETYGNSQRVELDICIPSLKLAFEYQGELHSNEEIQDRDKMKRQLCKELNFTLIEIPHWWDGTKDSIIATIHKYRPDLVKERGAGSAVIPHMTLKECDGELK